MALPAGKMIYNREHVFAVAKGKAYPIEERGDPAIVFRSGENVIPLTLTK